MTLLIATDEAGYGPRLGPLVIVATAWRLSPQWDISTADCMLREPLHIDNVGKFHIDDSKRIFKRPKAKAGEPTSASSIDRITDAVAHWVGLPVPSIDTANWLRSVATDDFGSLVKQPWFKTLAAKRSLTRTTTAGSTADPITEALIRHWSRGGWQLVSIAARIIDAASFNAMLDRSGNKADLLSDSTCGLAIKLANRIYETSDRSVIIQSDRFGGRAYYAGLVQHHCPQYNVQVTAQSSQSSSYRLTDSTEPTRSIQPTPHASNRHGAKTKERPTTIDWSFTVGGDSFPPVAMSSIIAKSTRERLMDLLNRYFQTETASDPKLGKNLKPTAGYTVDANRFLCDISAYRVAAGIDDQILIRKK
ncbi:MAG TPA: hypothetical protein DDZ51_30955 [Planctomycetaceae bacterium]|nr:hypothetical protein [Planctomycetaceae bacterium]